MSAARFTDSPSLIRFHEALLSSAPLLKGQQSSASPSAS
jgi:hypothetical protein